MFKMDSRRSGFGNKRVSKDDSQQMSLQKLEIERDIKRARTEHVSENESSLNSSIYAENSVKNQEMSPLSNISYSCNRSKKSSSDKSSTSTDKSDWIEKSKEQKKVKIKLPKKRNLKSS